MPYHLRGNLHQAVGFITFSLATMALAQPGQVGQSSEWEATGFNNGRRIVRDANGYFHAFWHSQPLLPAAPAGTGCDIYYAYTTITAAEPPSMAAQGMWSTPANLTAVLENEDNRYPSVAIEYEIFDGAWSNYNRLHVVWQAIPHGGLRYETMYAALPVANPPASPPPWTTCSNLSQTADTDSLVPAIAINQYGPNATRQHLHVVWQEEDINPGTQQPPAEDGWYSDIAYIRSTNSGAAWTGPAGGWSGHHWDNITQTTTNSQMPSISCILDQHTGTPAQRGRREMGYNTNTVHVAYHEDTGGVGINVFYLKSPNDGLNWMPRVNVSTNYTMLTEEDFNAYPCIAIDMLDHPHIVSMMYEMLRWEPMRTGGAQYLPGISPSQARAFPGPYIGMYGVMVNSCLWAYYDGNAWLTSDPTSDQDNEFPTVALDRWMHVNFNYQDYNSGSTDYEIYRHYNLNSTPPQYPPVAPNYTGWNFPATNDSQDADNDDLFPNLAHKKVAMYQAPSEAAMSGYDEVWTKVIGHGPLSATSSAMSRQIWQDGNMTWDRGYLLYKLIRIIGTNGASIANNEPASAAKGTDFGVAAISAGLTNRLIVTNAGTEALAIFSVVINGAGFAVTNTPGSVEANSASNFLVMFQPAASGTYAGNFQLLNNSTQGAYRVYLAGQGKYAVDATAGVHGAVSPLGRVYLFAGESTSFVVQADSGYYIATLVTNSAEVRGAAGLLATTVHWSNVTAHGSQAAGFGSITVDTAANGTPMPWLRDFYTDEPTLSALGSNALLDTDGDTLLGWQEYGADTDPTNAASVFAVAPVENRTAPYRVITWRASTACQYNVYWQSNLVNAFTNQLLITNLVPVTTGWISRTDAVHGAINPIFYRLGVQRR